MLKDIAYVDLLIKCKYRASHRTGNHIWFLELPTKGGRK
jgi:hypothetical protein